MCLLARFLVQIGVSYLKNGHFLKRQIGIRRAFIASSLVAIFCTGMFSNCAFATLDQHQEFLYKHNDDYELGKELNLNNIVLTEEPGWKDSYEEMINLINKNFVTIKSQFSYDKIKKNLSVIFQLDDKQFSLLENHKLIPNMDDLILKYFIFYKEAYLSKFSGYLELHFINEAVFFTYFRIFILDCPYYKELKKAIKAIKDILKSPELKKSKTDTDVSSNRKTEEVLKEVLKNSEKVVPKKNTNTSKKTFVYIALCLFFIIVVVALVTISFTGPKGNKKESKANEIDDRECGEQSSKRPSYSEEGEQGSEEPPYGEESKYIEGPDKAGNQNGGIIKKAAVALGVGGGISGAGYLTYKACGPSVAEKDEEKSSPVKGLPEKDSEESGNEDVALKGRQDKEKVTNPEKSNENGDSAKSFSRYIKETTILSSERGTNAEYDEKSKDNSSSAGSFPFFRKEKSYTGYSESKALKKQSMERVLDFEKSSHRDKRNRPLLSFRRRTDSTISEENQETDKTVEFGKSKYDDGDSRQIPSFSSRWSTGTQTRRGGYFSRKI